MTVEEPFKRAEQRLTDFVRAGDPQDVDLDRLTGRGIGHRAFRCAGGDSQLACDRHGGSGFGDHPEDFVSRSLPVRPATPAKRVIAVVVETRSVA